MEGGSGHHLLRRLFTNHVMRGDMTGIVNIPEDSTSSSPASPPGQSSSLSILVHLERSAWPWHRAGLTHGCDSVATRTSCFSENVALNKKGISWYRSWVMQFSALTYSAPRHEASARSTSTSSQLVRLMHTGQKNGCIQEVPYIHCSSRSSWGGPSD